MSRRTIGALIVLGTTLSALACTITLPIDVPRLEVGEMQEMTETVPLDDIDEATVDVVFGAGELTLEAGGEEELFRGRFRYNVEEWEPTVSYEEGELSIEQGGTEDDWGMPTGRARNEWALELSPEIPLDVDMRLGAGDGELDFGGLQLQRLELDVGAGDFEVSFDGPNPVAMDRFTVDSGAARLVVDRIGDASPEEVRVQGGVGDVTFDFTGGWANSSDIDITAGVGAVTLRLPESVGVEVNAGGGLSNVDTTGFEQDGNTYTNEAFGEAETELRINVTTGVGQLNLISVSDGE